MKIFKVLLLSSSLALDCYTCDEYGYTLCDQNKVLTTCEPDQTSCFIEEHQIHGNMARISFMKLFKLFQLVYLKQDKYKSKAYETLGDADFFRKRFVK